MLTAISGWLSLESSWDALGQASSSRPPTTKWVEERVFSKPLACSLSLLTT